MNVEEFERANLTELRQKANEHLSAVETSGFGDRPALLLTAKFYMDEIERREHTRERRYDVWVSWRDLVLETIVILLIGWEIVGGNDQIDVLRKLNRSAGETASTLSAVREAQEKSLATQKEMLQSQVKLLTETQNTLGTQLDVARRQQKLISSQLAIQERLYAEQQLKPEIELRAPSFTKGKGFTIVNVSHSSPPLIGYSPRLVPNEHTWIVDLYFLIRNVGTKNLVNLSILPEFPSAIKVQCVDYPRWGLFGDLPDDCHPSLGRIPAIYPVPKNTKPPEANRVSSPEADFTFRIRILVPDNLLRFDMNLVLVADNLSPTLFRAQFLSAYP